MKQFTDTTGPVRPGEELDVPRLEPYLRRTFKGTTEEMKKLLQEGLKDSKKFPAVNKQEPPGFGPEAPQKSSQAPPPPRAPLFAVIPTLGVGGPLAILALLFPSLFGGVLVLFRQWGAYFTVVSVVSLLYCLQEWCAAALVESWWGTRTALWLTTTFITLAGVIWAWRRNVTRS